MNDNDNLIPREPIFLPEKYAHLSAEEYLEALIEYVEKYRQFTTLHIVDFMTMNQWELLPEEWRNVLLTDNIDQDWTESIIQITSGSDINQNWPDSLKEFIRDTHDIALPRINKAGTQQTKSKLDKRILPGMIDKKIHEVEYMTPVIKCIAQKSNLNSIVDLGAGQGYLSRSIAFQNGLKVLAIDSSEIQTCGAKKFDDRAIKYLDKSDLNLSHVTDFITTENASEILTKHGNVSEDWLLCGLHTCGDLSCDMIKLFASSKEMKSFVNVGCCYHFLTDQNGFPMTEKTSFRFKPTEKMLACQAPSRWIDQKQETLAAFEHHFFRSLLQFIMVKKGLTDISIAPVVGRLNKKKDFLSFALYVEAALKRLHLEGQITSEESEEYYSKYKMGQVDKQIIILWTIRVLFGPILESIILIDRWIYLNDHIPNSDTKSVSLWPLFDPITSPRNIVIVATK